ncbi:hypothetical protein FQZ97_1177530 [compost metagenome]
MRQRVQSLLRAEPAVPAVADGDMADLVAQDHVEDLDGAKGCGGVDLAQAGLDQRGGVEPARFERARHQRHARGDVVLRLHAHFPQAIVRGEVAVVEAQALQVRVQQAEVGRFF